MRDDTHTSGGGESESESDLESGSGKTGIRRLLALAFVAITNARQNVITEIGRLKRLDETAHQRLNDRLRPVVLGLLTTAVAVSLFVQPAAAQYCSEGIGLLVADTQMMLWQIVLGLLVVIALVGLVVRAFPLFTGATAVGNVMLIGVIIGVIGFVFIITFIDMGLSYVGGPGVGEGCSPFL